MSRLFDDASSQYLAIDTPAVTGEPLTQTCWARTNDVAILQITMYVGDKDTTNQNIFQTLIRGDVAGDLIRASQFGGGSTASAGSTSGVTVNVWHTEVGAFIASNSRAAYRDGANKGTNTTSLTTSGVDKTVIGAGFGTGSPVSPMSGDLAEVGIYAANIGDDRALMLSKGFVPILVDLANLASYWPLYGNNSPEIDLVGGLNLTLVNAPTKSDHPRVYTPRRR